MITKLYKLFYAGVVSCGIAAALTACTDTWEEHYESLGDNSGMHEGSLWQAIKSNPDLSNFASVIEGCDFAKTLDGSQVFSVFAPTNANFSQAEAQALIASYRQQVQDSVVEENNTVLKEFIQNHIALYNYSVSSASNDSIMLMNGKYALLKSKELSGVNLIEKNQLYSNGVLYTIEEPIGYLSNVFEYISKDADLDSLHSFLYNKRFYYREFMPEFSVPGSIVDGKTQYLDSVFKQRNDLFSTLGLLSTEDSSYIMVAPTNEVWRQLIEEYEPYFSYPANVNKRDSLVYTNSRMAIVEGTTFSHSFNTDASLQDSAMSESSMKAYSHRRLMWGAPFEYYQYTKPLTPPYGALAQDEVIKCSNGELRKAKQWNIDKQMTFLRYIIVEAEDRSSIKDIQKAPDERGDSVPLATSAIRYVTSDNTKFYSKVWENSFVQFLPQRAASNYYVNFILPDVFSNVGYDIYLVTVPALANDSNATKQQRLPVKFAASLFWPGGPAQGETLVDKLNGDAKTFETTSDIVNYIMLAEDYKFDVCTYDIDDDEMQVLLRVETKVTNSQLRNEVYTRDMYIDCILMVPHGSLKLVDALPEDDNITKSHWGSPGLLMYPHGQYDDRPYKWWYMQR